MLLVHIVQGEGGDDACDFVDELGDIYRLWCQKQGLTWTTTEKSRGHLTARVAGKGAGRAFQGEEGKHCIQRVPRGEKRGRRQTSFVSVGLLPPVPVDDFSPLPENEVEVITQTGKQKAGGQNANKVASAVRMRHLPTGLSVFINGRDQIANRKRAMEVLSQRVHEQRNGNRQQQYRDASREQLADRGRGGKVRTYNLIDSRVSDHRTGRQTGNVKSVFRGHLDLVR